MTLETQAAFAIRLGVVDSYVTKLKKEDRLVMSENKIDVEASLRKIEETRDPNRDDVSRRHAKTRQEKTNLPETIAPPPPRHDSVAENEDLINKGYQGARAVKERYTALTAKAEYEKLIGNLIPREEAEAALRFIGATVFSLLETLPGQNAAILAPITDVTEIEAQLVEACRNVQAGLGDAIARQRAAALEKARE